jgi:hypothetical protein
MGIITDFAETAVQKIDNTYDKYSKMVGDASSIISDPTEAINKNITAAKTTVFSKVTSFVDEILYQAPQSNNEINKPPISDSVTFWCPETSTEIYGLSSKDGNHNWLRIEAFFIDKLHFDSRLEPTSRFGKPEFIFNFLMPRDLLHQKHLKCMPD